MQEHSVSLRKVLARGVEQRLEAIGRSRWSVAADAGMSRRTLQAVLRAAVGIRVSTLAGLAWALECMPRYLLEDTNVCAPPTCPTSACIDLPSVIACNISTSWPRRFASVAALADASHISTSQLYVILRAGCGTSIDHVAKIGRALELSAAELVSAAKRRAHEQIPESCTRVPRR
jgi:DNA-binding Xre family transcriptional regulator